MNVCHKKPLIFGSLYLLLVFVPWGNSAPLEVPTHDEDYIQLEDSSEFNSTEWESPKGRAKAEILNLQLKLAIQQQQIDNLEHEVKAESSRISTLSLNLTDTLMEKLLPVWILALHNKANLNDLETKAEVNGNRSLKNELEIANVKELVGSFHPTDKKQAVPVPTSLPEHGTLSGPEMVLLMKEGTAVVRGVDWKSDDKDGGAGSVGRVRSKFEVPGTGFWVLVRWPNGKMVRHRMGADGKYELKLADESLPRTTTTVAPPVSRRTTGTLSGPAMAALLKIGTAVVRGADWSYDDQDGGAGRIGHTTSEIAGGWVRVRWTNGNEYRYAMGFLGEYDLKLADEGHPVDSTQNVITEVPRTGELSGPEIVPLLKIGTAVVRGTDWKWENQDGGAGNIGHITRDLDSLKLIRVKWSNGKENSYRMGYDGKYDLKLAGEAMTSPNKV